MIYLRLFFEFFKIGLFSIGGGMATIPFLFDLSKKTDWFSIEELTNMIAVGESTPGPIGVNMSTYVGMNTSGFLGALCSTMGLVCPSIIVIVIVYYVLMRFYQNQIVKTVLSFLRLSVIGLITFALWQVLRICIFPNNEFSVIPAAFFVILTVLIIKNKKIHPIIWILSGAILGLLFF